MNRSKIMTFAAYALSIFVFYVIIPFVSAAPDKEALKITPSQFDMGVVEEGRIITAVATIENRGNTVVEITNVRTN